MARLPRLVLPGHAHCVIQRGHGGRPVFADDTDRAAYLDALRTQAAVLRVQVLAWALLDTQVMLLAQPQDATSLSALMQAVGRRYVSTYNRRHGLRGSLWDGRFRCAPVEPGPTLLDLLAWVDGQGANLQHTSAGLRLAGAPDALLADPPEFWALGNTPFEREAAYQQRLTRGPSAAQAAHWLRAALGGWAIGAAPFSDALGDATDRPLHPRRAGRPRNSPRNSPHT